MSSDETGTPAEKRKAAPLWREAFLPRPKDNFLFLRWIEPRCELKGDILLTHGMGEHSGRYLHVGEFLAAHGYRVCAYDLRGHGRSSGKRGDIVSYDILLNDVEATTRHYTRAGIPTFFYGHSLGGQIILNSIVEDKRVVSGAIVASPWLALVFRPNPIKLLLAKVALKIHPSMTQTSGLDDSRLSRDKEFLRSMKDMNLVHKKMSARMYSELTRGARRALKAAGHFTQPLLLLHGADDPITSITATQEFFSHAASRDKTMKVYPDTLHETHNDIGREQVLNEVLAWLDARTQRVSG